MQQLYTRGSVVESAYLIDDLLAITIGESPAKEFQATNAIVGSLEYFLQGLEAHRPGRLFDVSVRKKEKVKLIPFSTVESMMKQYRFGFETNVFLARVLEHTTLSLAQQGKSVPEELAQYRARARHFSRLVNGIAEFAHIHGLRELEKIAAAKRSREFFIDGLILSREIALRAISAPSEPLSRYILRFKKNSALCREGGAAGSMYILLRGKVSVSAKGRKVATISEAGEAFGELALFLDGHRTASVVAEEDTDVYEIKRRDLPRFFEGHPALFHNIACTLSKRIHDNIENILRFEQKINELKKEEFRTRGRYDSLSERSKLEIAAFCQELVEYQLRCDSPALDRFLNENYLRQARAI
jgi:CRP-like cAMP-binding protein